MAIFLTPETRSRTTRGMGVKLCRVVQLGRVRVCAKFGVYWTLSSRSLKLGPNSTGGLFPCPRFPENTPREQAKGCD